MLELILTRGIPASGKTTWAREWVARDPTHRARVNRDDIRESVFGELPRYDEFHVTCLQNDMIKALLYAGRSIVVDNTNLNDVHVQQLRNLGRMYTATVTILNFPVALSEALRRDTGRTRKVGSDVIRRFAHQYPAWVLA
jgi:Predicted kinase